MRLFIEVHDSYIDKDVMYNMIFTNGYRRMVYDKVLIRCTLIAPLSSSLNRMSRNVLAVIISGCVCENRKSLTRGVLTRGFELLS